MRKTITLLLLVAGALAVSASPLWAQVTSTFTPTFTNTPTSTNTNTRTFTPTNSPTRTATNSPTSTLLVPTVTYTNTPTNSPTNTPTSTLLAPTATFTPTISPTLGANCAATTVVNFYGNLDSTQRADQPGGILQLGTMALPVLPFMITGGPLNGIKAQIIPYQSGNTMQQILDLSQPPDSGPQAYPNHNQALVMGGSNLSGARSAGVSTYAWNQGTAFPPACTTIKTVVDSIGNTRQITFQFYQVNDMGTAVPPVNAGQPATQTAYAWYAFETTGGQQPGNTNLLGGTGIVEGDTSSTCPFDRGVSGDSFLGDMIYFNGNGSLASEGGGWIRGGIITQGKADLYLPPAGPNGVLRVQLNFGSAGMLGYGQRDGLTGDPLPSSCNNTTPDTPTPTGTVVPTDTPTPLPTSGPTTVVMVYVNSEGACAGAFGCSITFVQACRQLNLDFSTSYIMMRIGATCGCQPSDIMQLRLTGMGWDEICAHYGLDWAAFTADLQTRVETLQPETVTINQLLRGASYDPSHFPIATPIPMPDTLTQNAPYTETCPLCQ